MFDKLIVTEPEGADFKNRRSYFVVSSLVVGVLFITAVVISIFAADFGLGKGGFELTEMLSPVDMAAVEPETPKPQQPTTSRSQNQLPTRQVNMLSVANNTIVPPTISEVPNTQMSVPAGRFVISKFDTNPDNSNGTGRDTSGPISDGTGISTPPEVIENTPVPDPPIVKTPPAQRQVSLGVINGKASSLPIPAYPAPAKAVGAQGAVNVQVMIDEGGKVISANAVSGHILLRAAAEKAAWGARFSPTYLSHTAVKVTGVIVYNFIR